jgi:hypothetical protein
MHQVTEEELLSLGAEWRRSTPPALRIRVADIADRAPVAGQDTVTPRTKSQAWTPARAMALATAGVAVLLLAIPFSRDAIAHQAYRVLQSLGIAPSTQLVTYQTQGADEVNASLRHGQQEVGAGRAWRVRTFYGGFGGNVPPNASPDVRRIDRADTLLAAVTIPLLAPDGPYRGQPLSFDHALLAPDGVVLAFFGSGDTEVMLVEAPVVPGKPITFSRAVVGRDGIIIGVPPAIETLDIGGQRVTWDPDTTRLRPALSALRWEDAGVSYSLYGRALTKNDAVMLFSSLHPLN